MPSVYLETSFVSACVTTRKDSASVYRRRTSIEWWNSFGMAYQLFVSQEVLEELSHAKFRGRKQAMDPLIDEIRAIRADISARYGNDVDRLCRHLQEAQRKQQRPIVSRKTKRLRKVG